MRSPIAWLAASSAALVVLAGCGSDEQKKSSGPRIDSAAATQLADRSERIAGLLEAGDECAAAHEADRLKGEAQTAVDEGRVPTALAEELLTRADELVNQVNCEEVVPPPSEDEDETGRGKKDKDKGRGREEEDD